MLEGSVYIQNVTSFSEPDSSWDCHKYVNHAFELKQSQAAGDTFAKTFSVQKNLS